MTGKAGGPVYKTIVPGAGQGGGVETNGVSDTGGAGALAAVGAAGGAAVGGAGGAAGADLTAVGAACGAAVGGAGRAAGADLAAGASGPPPARSSFAKS